MVDKNITKALQKYSGQIQNLNKEEEKLQERRSVEMFFSFDIVNSSSYKTLNFTGWSQVIITLFARIQEKIARKIPSAEMWKILGDEVIFIVPVLEKQDIFIYISNVFEILNQMISQLKTGTFFEDQELRGFDQDLMRIHNIISLKAAAWMAIIGEEIRPEKYDNLMKRFKLQEGYEIFEFLGNDIDTGFRIKEHTQDKRLVISYELAYILSGNDDYRNTINIITYKHLKGIWQNHLYPIIWYHDEKFADGKSLEDSFYYDERENSELVDSYFKNKKDPPLQSKMYEDIVYALNKILADQKLEDKFLKIDRVIEESQNNIKHLLDPRFFLRLHCVAVCFDQSRKKILIMKRSEHREKLAGCWEFGCAKGSLEKTLVEQIEEDYLSDFGIKIKVVCNNDRKDVQPLPLAIYEAEGEQGKDKGIITLAEVIGDVDIEGFQGEKHSQLRWIGEEEAKRFSAPTVDDFHHTLSTAFRWLREGRIDGWKTGGRG